MPINTPPQQNNNGPRQALPRSRRVAVVASASGMHARTAGTGAGSTDLPAHGSRHGRPTPP